MDDEFPDADDEFELAHEDDFEVLNELEGFTNPAPKKVAVKPPEKQKPKELPPHTSTQKSIEVPQTQTVTNTETQKVNGNSEKSSEVDDDFSLLEFTPTPITTPTVRELESSRKNGLNLSISQSSRHDESSRIDGTQMRTVDELLADISNNLGESESSRHGESSRNDRTQKRTVEDLLADVSNNLGGSYVDNSVLFEPDFMEQTRKRPRWNQYEEMIELIRRERKMHNAKESSGISYKHQPIERIQFRTDSVTTRVPSWNFIAVTRNEDGQRLYVRMTENKRKIIAKTRPAAGLLSVSYSQLKAEAEEIIVKNVQRASLPQPIPTSNQNIDDQLWVDKYRPKKYMELLSDETINRRFLHWLKLWDKVVFHREPIRHKRRKLPENNKKFWLKNFKQEDVEELDSKGYPVYRIALLSGPPGLGKTTLAHVAAKHAGYNVVEINASDDREPSAFREALLSSTQMQAVIGADPRPNCLVLDEIDGAPSASIDLLIKFVQGKLVQKGKKNKQKMEKMKEGCQRPVICICNDLYAPALRQLKAMALVIPVPEVRPEMLADRLMEIARKEGLQVEIRDLMQLAERSGCDVRTCLGALQYMRGANMKENLSLGLKDTRKGLFDSWKTLLQIPMNQKGILAPHERIGLVLKTVQRGESDRLAQGVFHNYPTICKEKMEPIAISLEWFQFFDEITRMVSARQVWTIMPYTNYAFVIWNFNLASATQNPKLSYPMAFFEMNQKLGRNNSILTASQKSCGIDRSTLALDIAPLLPELLTPRLRSVSAHLYSPKEKSELMNLVNVMLDYGLTLIQEKKPDGGFEYHLEPDLFEIGVFPDCKYRRVLSYAVKQIVIQELEVERVKRAAAAVSAVTNRQQPQKAIEVKETEESVKTKETKITHEDKTKNNVPNHLKQLEPISVRPFDGKYQDFFKKFKDAGQTKFEEQKSLGLTTETSSREKAPVPNKMYLFKKDVWYKFKEGFTNAVRRNIKMEDLL